MNLEEQIKLELTIRTLLEMRFGDGTGTNPQVSIATKELTSILTKNREIAVKEFVEVFEKDGELYEHLSIMFNAMYKMNHQPTFYFGAEGLVEDLQEKLCKDLPVTKPSKEKPMQERHDDFIILSATRYALGRQTYIVSETCEYLKKIWKDLSLLTQTFMKHEIEEAIQKGEAGMDCDVAEWEEILELKDD